MGSFEEILRRKKERAAKRKAKRAEIGMDRPINQTRSMTKNKLDDLWSFYIKLRDRSIYGPVCRIRKARNCTGLGEVAYHIIPKIRGDATRWDFENGALACSACNGGEMMNRDLYADYQVNIFGSELIERLKLKSRIGAKFSRVDLWAIAEGIRAEISRVKIGAVRGTH